jgi:arabinose-5-phosphate isomerase
MTHHPTAVHPEMLAAEAMCVMKEKKIDELPVVDSCAHPVGLLDVQDILKAGLV